jgi:hypothetical protein
LDDQQNRFSAVGSDTNGRSVSSSQTDPVLIVMTNLQRRLKKLEGGLTDPAGLVPHSKKWLIYWDRQYDLFLSEKDRNAIWLSSIAAYRAVMKYAHEEPSSLA